jgi:photosystem II stability/assembly factor-like uncharacterized protein
MSIVVNSSGHIYAGGQFGFIRSTDDGNTWLTIDLKYDSPGINAIGFNSAGHIFACDSYYGISRSTDNGNSWVNVNNGLILTDIWSINFKGDGYIFVS